MGLLPGLRADISSMQTGPLTGRHRLPDVSAGMDRGHMPDGPRVPADPAFRGHDKTSKSRGAW